MTVDPETIARRYHSDASALRAALPFLEQGYTPPFLVRYRRDELGGADEPALEALAEALRQDRQLAQRRDELRQRLASSGVEDPPLAEAIERASHHRQLDRLARRIRSEAADHSPAQALAARLLVPHRDDPQSIEALATAVCGADQAEAALAGLEAALAARMASHTRLIDTATRWLGRNAKISVLEIHDPHLDSPGGAEAAEEQADSGAAPQPQQEAEETPPQQEAPLGGHATAEQAAAKESTAEQATAEQAAAGHVSPPAAEPVQSEGSAPAVDSTATAPSDAELASQAKQLSQATQASEATAKLPAPPSPAGEAISAGEAVDHRAAAASDRSPVAEPPPGEETPAEDAKSAAGEGTNAAGAAAPLSEKAAGPKGAGKPAREKKAKERKKISPRQRRRRWLVSVLQPLAGKTFAPNKLTAFQLVMLGRGLRSQVARCGFQYDSGRLIELLRDTAAKLNPVHAERLGQAAVEIEASLRESAEAAWWEDLLDAAATRLVHVAGEQLRRQMLREPVQANVVLAIDAVGPRTAALAILGPHNELLHTEDVPCQSSAPIRQQLVARLGELIHQYHVDLLVLSNGPARRSCMVSLTELLEQSQGSGIRWMLADRAGAELFSNGPAGNRELRSTPRRFRAAAWLAQAVRDPTRAMAKVDAAKLRLGSYQRELSEEALAAALHEVVSSGVSRIGVDVNAADRGSLAALPGMDPRTAEAIDRLRRESLIVSRAQLSELETWSDEVARRQALGFLRVFGGENPLDATAIHPDDYPLAERLMKALEVPMPPAAPPGYEPPEYETPSVVETAAKPPAAGEGSAAQPSEAHGAEAPKPQSAAAELSATESSPATETAAAAESAPETSAPETSAPETSAPETPSSSGEERATDDAAATDVDTDSAATGDAAATGNAVASEPPTASGEEEPTAETAADPLAVGFGPAAGNKPAEAPSPSPRPEPPRAAEPYRHPLPPLEKLLRCAKEWQVGPGRAQSIVEWLCDPFSDYLEPAAPSATMERVPKLQDLTPGTPVSGVVVGVAPFGVFVELGPDCSGLIHVSRFSETYVEDLHEVAQIGDVVTAWVTEIDTKRRRVALSGISPDRPQRHRGAPLREQGSGRPPRGGRPTAARGAGGKTPQAPREPAGREAAGRAPGRGGPRTGAAAGRGEGRGKRPGGRDARGDRGPTSYTRVSRKAVPAEPLSDEKIQGKEPLRSFSDLMQFYKTKQEPPQGRSAGPEAPSAAENTPTGTAPGPEAGHDDSAAPPQRPSETPGGETPSADSQATPPPSEPSSADASAAAENEATGSSEETIRRDPAAATERHA